MTRSPKTSTSPRKRAADIKKGQTAFKNIVDSARTIFDLLDKYGRDILAKLGEGQLGAAKALMPRALKLQNESFEEMAATMAGASNVLNRLSHPVSPSERPCSFYCAPSPGDRGCVYCGQPKSKHTKKVQNKQSEYSKRRPAHV